MSNPNPIDAGFDFFDIELWGARVPQAEFAALRRLSPVHWITHTGETNPFDDGGLWAVTKHAHIKAIARDSDVWSTNANGYLPTFPSVADRDAVEASKAMLVNHDPPTHTRLRQLVSRVFTPRSIAQLEDDLRQAARDIVTRAADKGAGDFVEDIAALLPIYAIAELLGIPEDDREQVFRWANSLITGDDEDARYEDPATSSAQLFAYAYQMAEDRRRHPQDDIVTLLVNADIDGESLRSSNSAISCCCSRWRAMKRPGMRPRWVWMHSSAIQTSGSCSSGSDPLRQQTKSCAIPPRLS